MRKRTLVDDSNDCWARGASCLGIPEMWVLLFERKHFEFICACWSRRMSFCFLKHMVCMAIRQKKSRTENRSSFFWRDLQQCLWRIRVSSDCACFVLLEASAICFQSSSVLCFLPWNCTLLLRLGYNFVKNCHATCNYHIVGGIYDELDW